VTARASRSRRAPLAAKRPKRAVKKSPPAAGEAYRRIWAVARRIPRGRVATYGQIAALAGYPHAPRLGGYAMYALPPGSPIPWHRVVAAGGRLSIARLDPENALTQRLRLEAEGVTFDPRGRVKMERHGWKRGRGQGRPAATPRRSPS